MSESLLATDFAKYERETARLKRRTHYLQTCAMLALSGEAWVVWAALNPDPEVLRIATEHAARMRKLGLEAMGVDDGGD